MPRKKKEKKEKLVKKPKKRGRKPKGGKIVEKNVILSNKKDSVENIILHLKCSSKDIEKEKINNEEENEIKSYVINQTKNTMINFDTYKKNNLLNKPNNEIDGIDKDLIWEKIKLLKLQLHTNDIADKRSNCSEKQVIVFRENVHMDTHCSDKNVRLGTHCSVKQTK